MAELEKGIGEVGQIVACDADVANPAGLLGNESVFISTQIGLSQWLSDSPDANAQGIGAATPE